MYKEKIIKNDCKSKTDVQYQQNIENHKLKKEEEISNKLRDLYFTNDINNFTLKFRNIIEDYVVPNKVDPFIYSTNEKFIFSVDVNEDRIKKYYLFNHLFTSMNVNFPLPRDSFKTITLKKNDENSIILSFWLSTTNKITNKELLNFPLCIYANQDIFKRDINNKLKEEETALYFFKHNPVLNTGFSINSNIKEIVFQKLMIFMTLYEANLTSSNYIFDEIKLLKPQVFTFKIRDMCFSISLTKLIILSPNTILISNNQLKVEDYIDSLDKREQEFIEKKNYLTFYEFFFFNFSENFIKTMYNTRNLPTLIKFSDLVDLYDIKEGKIYIFKKEEDINNIVYACILKLTSNHARLLLFFDSSIKGTLSSSIKMFSINDIKNKIYDPNFIFDKQLFPNIIGRLN